ncbi:MAG: hypothetical protein AAFX50_12760 [Acidobacteriota bacterium]
MRHLPTSDPASRPFGARWFRRLVAVSALVAAAASPAFAGGAPDIDVEEISISPDVTIEYFGAALTDHQATKIGTPGAALDFAVLPDGVEVTGFHIDLDKTLFAVDQPVSFGGQLVTPRDVASSDGNVITLALDGAALGVARGVGVDAVTLSSAGDLVVSFDTALELGGLLVNDEDLVAVGGGPPTVVFDGSLAGVPPGIDLDAAHFLDATALAASFDGTFELAGTVVDDEDVAVFDGSTLVEKLYDGSGVSPSAWRRGADLGGVFIMELPPDPTLIFEDDFESGDLSGWTATIP